MTKTTPEQNKALVLKAFDTLFNKRNYEFAEEFWSGRYVQHSAHIRPGRDGLFNLIRALPDTLRYENQLIIAEAAYRTSDETTARDSLNSERVAAGLLAVPGTVTGTALLDSIMTEKYVVTFQSIEAWSDYKRTCIPALVPAAGTAVIGRLPYSINEVNTNPNVPSPEPARNSNDPNAC